MPSELDQLRRENARLIALLKAHGIPCYPSEPASAESKPVAAAGARATHRPEPMHGKPASARNHGWPAATASTGSCCPWQMRRSTATWPVITPSASTPCWRTTCSASLW